MALQSQLNFSVKKSNRRSSKKNVNSIKENVVAKRILFDDLAHVSPSKKRKQDENANTFEPYFKEKTKNISSFTTSKQIFHTGQPSRLVCRSKEISEIESFISEHVIKRKAGSLYISGAPGTGKTTSLMSVIKSWDSKISYAFINCMSINSAADIYKSIARELKLPSKILNAKNISKCLEKHIVTSDKMNILILDEIDHLDSKGQEVLYSLFEWPQLPKSSLILIGIANALDLTDRMLPRLQAFKCEPKLMHFQPYTKDEIISILEDRLSELKFSSPIIKPAALQLCARKISACTGDIRKALDVCRRAIEVVEQKNKKSAVLKSTSDDRSNPGSPMKRSTMIDLCVDLPDISSVLHEVYGSRLKTSSTETVTMPLQQMVLLCTLILMKKNCKTQDMNLGKLYDVYKRVCQRREISALGECEFNGLCRLVETRGFLELKSAKVMRMTKIVLKVDEGEAEYILQDKAMLPAILSDTSVLSAGKSYIR